LAPIKSAADTPVRTPCGFRPIEEIQPGDSVLSRIENDPNGAVETKPVSRVFSRISEIWQVRFGDESLFTTEEHPFYVIKKGWVAAARLEPGDIVAGCDNRQSTVRATFRTGRVERVFNLEVEENHTYFVGIGSDSVAVWVHNQCDFKVARSIVEEVGGRQIKKGQAVYLSKLVNDGEYETAKTYLAGRKIGMTVEEAELAISKLSEASTKRAKPEWLKRLEEGNEFNKSQAKRFPHNEVYIDAPGGRYVRVDSYNDVTGEIVSRKLTQLEQIQEQTAIGYVNELAKKYPPGAKISGVPSQLAGSGHQNAELAGKILNADGKMILEVPVQKKAVPQAVIDAANEKGIIIRDINGKVYNP
jgi:Pretoxin HINT domain